MLFKLYRGGVQEFRNEVKRIRSSTLPGRDTTFSCYRRAAYTTRLPVKLGSLYAYRLPVLMDPELTIGSTTVHYKRSIDSS